MKYFFLIFYILLIVNCKNKLNNNSSCQNLYEDEYIELCLPNIEWESIVKDSSSILFRNMTNDSLEINKTFIALMIDDSYDQNKLNAEAYRNEYLIRKEEDKNLNIEIISKSKENINGKTFYDFEIIENNKGLYTYFAIYKKQNTTYSINAIIKEKDRNEINKNDFLNFFKSLKIK